MENSGIDAETGIDLFAAVRSDMFARKLRREQRRGCVYAYVAPFYLSLAKRHSLSHQNFVTATGLPVQI